MRRSDIELAIMDIYRAALTAAQPCACGRQRCTLGQHCWDSTRNMTPGPHAHSYEPAMAGTSLLATDDDPPPDGTAQLHDEFQRLFQMAQLSARNLTRMFDRVRPDRYIPLPDPATDDLWCRNHLQNVGQCEPRGKRGDLCDWCYRFGLTHNALPNAELMRAQYARGYKHTTERDIEAWKARHTHHPTPSRKRRKRAS